MTEISNPKFIKLYCATYYQPSSNDNVYKPPVDYYFSSKDELDEFAEHYKNLVSYFKVYEVIALNIDNIIYPLGKPLLLHRAGDRPFSI